MPSTNIALDVRDVCKDFPNPGGGTVHAVDHVSVVVQDGEFFSLLGPSGCGKSTLLRMLAGFERPTAGEIWIDGRLMGATPPYERPVNMVFQSYALFPHMTIAQNVAFGLEMAGRPPAEIAQRVADVLALVRLPEMGQRTPAQLSGGQQQRVALARAIVNHPKVLLLDEPLGALDMKLRKEMQFELKELQQQLGISFMYVTHDQEEALSMSDRIGVMNQGKILQIGTPTEIYERPNCRFVADFIGETNFLDGRVRAIEGQVAVVAVEVGGKGSEAKVDGKVPEVGNAPLEAGAMPVEAGAVPVEAGAAPLDAGAAALEVRGLTRNGLVVGAPAVLSVRPEKIELISAADRDAPSAANAFRGVVRSVAYIGSDTRVIVDLGPALAISAWEQNATSTLDPDAYYQVGEAVWVTWRAENALVLAE